MSTPKNFFVIKLKLYQAIFLYELYHIKTEIGTVENKITNFYTKIMGLPAKILEFALDILFPKFCLNCGTEGSYLCPDCFSLIEILDRQYCPFCFPPKLVFDGKTCFSCKQIKKLSGLYCAASYENFIVKKLIHQFKYEPYVRELAKPLSSLIITHLQHLNKIDILRSSFLLVPVPLHKKKLKQRGFNPPEEIAKEIAKILKIPIVNALVKIKQTPAQMELKKEKREKNVLGAFRCSKPDLIRDARILLLDDVFTTGATLEECARVLKDAGAKEVWGMVVARG